MSRSRRSSRLSPILRVQERSQSRSRIRPHLLRFELLEDRRVLSGMTPQIELFSASPALFVENLGQWGDPSVRFMHQGNGANVAITDAGPVFQVFQQEELDNSEAEESDGLLPALPDERLRFEDYVTHTLVFSAGFVGANDVTPLGLEASETVFNYFVGDEANWLCRSRKRTLGCSTKGTTTWKEKRRPRAS